MELAVKVVKILDKILSVIITIIFLLMLAYSLYSLWDIKKINDGGQLPDDLLKYKPSSTTDTLSLQELAKINPDVIGWIDIYDTHIDYPVVRGKDNKEYINKDVYGEFSFAGSIFLDSNNEKDFSDSYNMLYGHNMVNSGMFGDINMFCDREFFANHKEGELYTLTKSYKIDLFAVLETDASDSLIFKPSNLEGEEKVSLIKYIEGKSLFYREINLSNEDNIIALSTCCNTETNVRTVLFGSMKED